MADREDLIEAALEVYPEGLALLNRDGSVVFWNRSAEIITGFARAGVVRRALPQALEPLVDCRDYEGSPEPRNGPQLGRGSLVHAQHAQGHDVAVISRKVILRDDLGERIGTAAVFHVAERTAALPHGETSEGSEVRQSQAELQDRLQAAWELFVQEGVALGMLWVTVDQAEELKRTHGARACETMLESMERTLANALRPGEEIGRWGDNEFLIIAEEGRGDILANHAQVLAGIARTADFRWWGDRVSLTVSVGAAEAEEGEELAEVLKRARQAMEASTHAGGNHVTLAAGRQACSPS
ncbi:MAG TPA: diguanylate cyclase [Terracidiphilus sp.]|jgi:diguanylate cyclase (GGDEF)-like protein/PAS domain S-box-containing protein|nr:diguanylate cyclase [Terracidiphilus sp.]